MLQVPPFLMRDEVTVLTFLGRTGRGPKFDEPAVLRCQVDSRRRVVKAADGSDVIAEATIVAAPDDVDKLALESQVVIEGIPMHVISIKSAPTLAGKSNAQVYVG